MDKVDKIAVIIPNWNGKEVLRDCLDSLLLQSYPELEIVVVDNGSTDGSRELLSRGYPEVRKLWLKKNTGFCNAVNLGIQKTSSPYVVLLNNDTVAEPDFIQELVNAMESEPDVFSASALLRQAHQPELVDDAGDFYCALGWAYARGKDRPCADYQQQTDIFASCGGAVIYRREVLERLKGFDTAFFAYLEDIDLGYRARLAGYRNIYVPSAVVDHLGSAATGSRYNSFKVFHAARNSIYLIRKNMPWGQQLINLPFLMAGYLIKTLYFTSMGFGAAYRKGLGKGFCMPLAGKKTRFHWKNLKRYTRLQMELWENTWKRIKRR